MGERLFSICIPTFNRAPLLAGALESALAQKDEGFEIVVVDNASADDTQEVLARYPDPRIQVFRNAETVSMYANHNICVGRARAPWVVFLHSDDRLDANALGTLRQRIEGHQCDVVYPAKALHRDYVVGGDLLLSGPQSLSSLLRWPAGTPSGAAYRRRFLGEIPFREDLVAADFILLAEVLRRGGRIVVSAVNTIAIGEGEFQYSAKWQRSGDFVRDVSKAFKEIINLPGVARDVESGIRQWSDSEIAFLLMMLSHADESRIISRLQYGLGDRVSFKRDPRYRHVVLYRVLGWRMLQVAFRAAKQARQMLAHRAATK
jgi:glycosyltransferase involved in cell wall biosynthesis